MLPTWSSRGQIVFTSARTERANLYSVEADGSRLRVLVRNAADSFPAWSPDGTRIAFERPKSRCFGREIVVMRIDGSGLRVVTEGVFDAASHAWSPDGRTIAYGSEGSIYLVNADGSRKRFVDLRGRPAWRPVP